MPEPAHSAQPLTGQDAAYADSDTPAVPSPCLATIEAVPDGDRIRVKVQGELDIGGQLVQPDLYEALCRSGGGIDLDLCALEFCDCAGLNILLDLRRRALDQNKTVAIRSASPPVERLLDLTGVHILFMYPNSDDTDTPYTSGPHQDADQDLRTEVTQLRRAMQTRPTIDLARGMLMAAFGLSPQTAWTVLVTTSQNTNTKLHRLAQDLISTVQGAALPEAVQEQLAAAVAKANAAPAAAPTPQGATSVRSIVPEQLSTPPGAQLPCDT